MDATIRLVARILAYPLWFWAKLKRSRILRTILFVLVAVPTGVYAIAGSDGLSALVSFLLLGVQLLFGFAFMIIQFVGIFWFMSQTKTTIVYPGDEGMITWDDYWGNTKRMLRKLLPEVHRFPSEVSRVVVSEVCSGGWTY
jgi:hypothetical protein